jgi:hypothetical protein
MTPMPDADHGQVGGNLIWIIILDREGIEMNVAIMVNFDSVNNL